MPLTDLEGRSLGEMTVRDGGADILLGGLFATLEREGHNRYTMLVGGEEALHAEPPGGGLERLAVHHGEELYEARVSPLRNTATVRSRAGAEVARVSGGLLGLRYRLGFDGGERRASYVALLAFYHLLLVRSRAFRAVPAHLTPGGL